MQSTQSSITVAFRALVMLAFVGAISLIAFSGSAMPEKARIFWAKAWPAISSAISTAKANILAEAPHSNSKPQNNAFMPGQARNGVTNPPGQLTTDNQAVPLSILAPGSGGERNLPLASNVVPAEYQTSASSNRLSSSKSVEPSVVESCISRPGYSGQKDTNPFIAIQDRLRQLGATYYLLETWGNQRQFFRFYCQMAVGGNAGYTHYFEAINFDPMAAMADVLRQVEAWRFGSNKEQYGKRDSF